MGAGGGEHGSARIRGGVPADRGGTTRGEDQAIVGGLWSEDSLDAAVAKGGAEMSGRCGGDKRGGARGGRGGRRERGARGKLAERKRPGVRDLHVGIDGQAERSDDRAQGGGQYDIGDKPQVWCE